MFIKYKYNLETSIYSIPSLFSFLCTFSPKDIEIITRNPSYFFLLLFFSSLNMTYLPLKRGREEEFIHNITTMANYLIHFSKGAHDSFDPKRSNNSPGRFECRTCNRQFTSFQALGGHRASHKRPRLMVGGGGDLTNHQAKSKSHECSICGLEFVVGQALGGHMRRHRAAAISESHLSSPLQQVEGAKKVNDHEIRVFGVDLNLTPLENDLELGIRKIAPN